MFRLSSNGILTILLCITFSSAVWAQPQATTGVLEGKVTDESGSPLPDVRVTLTNQDTNYQKIVSTNDQGRFRGLQLPLGNYRVQAEIDGYFPGSRDDVPVTVGRTAIINLALKQKNTEETIMVTGTRPVVETTRTEVSSQIVERAIQALPNNGRNFLDFLNLTPGVGIV